MATATESTSELPSQAQAANLKTLTQAMGETKITDDSTKADSEKADEGESLEDGEIREDEEEEVDDGKPKTVFDSAKKFNLKVGPYDWKKVCLVATLMLVAPSIHALDVVL